MSEKRLSKPLQSLAQMGVPKSRRYDHSGHYHCAGPLPRKEKEVFVEVRVGPICLWTADLEQWGDVSGIMVGVGSLTVLTFARDLRDSQKKWVLWWLRGGNRYLCERADERKFGYPGRSRGAQICAGGGTWSQGQQGVSVRTGK